MSIGAGAGGGTQAAPCRASGLLEERDLETLSVLVVDDEPGMRMGVERALRHFVVELPELDAPVRFETAQAPSGEQALEVIRAKAPDILLLDYKLPGISGLEVLDATTDLAGDMLTVMITAYASLETAVSATKRGAYDFLAKPFTPDELKGAVRKAARHLILQRHAHRLAEEKRQVRFQFISVLAHELKAPLAAIEGYLRIIREHSAGTDPQVYDHMLDRSLVRLEGMRKLIMDLLDLTRIESGHKQRQLHEVDLAELAGHVVETVAPLAAERQIELAVHADKPVLMQADRGEIEIILNNLVTNAVKYNRPSGRVDVTLAADDHAVTVEVADTGIGMSPEEQARLFQDFVRIKNTKTRDILGSGLGLSIVRKLATLYGGQVRLVSQPDVGTTFTVTLDRAPAIDDDVRRNPQLAQG